MPVIRVTQKDLSASAVLEMQWVTATISKVELSRAASGKSNNYNITYILSENCPAPEKEIMKVYNDTRGLGDLYPVFAAVRGISLSEIKLGEELDTDELINASLDVHVIVEVYQNVPRNSVDGYLPTGKGNNATAF